MTVVADLKQVKWPANLLEASVRKHLCDIGVQEIKFNAMLTLPFVAAWAKAPADSGSPVPGNRFFNAGDFASWPGW